MNKLAIVLGVFGPANRTEAKIIDLTPEGQYPAGSLQAREGARYIVLGFEEKSLAQAIIDKLNMSKDWEYILGPDLSESDINAITPEEARDILSFSW